MTRKLLAVLLAAIVVMQVVVSPVAAAPLLGGSGPDLDVVRYGGDGDPSYIVEYDNESVESLQNWANASDQRRLINLDNQTGTATVAAPFWMVENIGATAILGNPSFEVATALLDTQLAERRYIESVELNYQRSYAEPVTNLLNVSRFSEPQEGFTGVDDPAFPTSGIAFSGDANETTMAESRAIIGADNITQTGSGVTVAVIDTGVNTANGRIFGNGTSGSDTRVLNASKNFITNETILDDGVNAVSDGNGHGTWVASAIAANTSDDTFDGVVPDASILALKALADDGSGSTSDIAQAVRYAADHDADVISMSLGSPVYSDALADAVSYAQEQGSVVVVAVGNSRQTTRWIASPADVDGVVSVAATNGSEPGTAGTAYFSQLGPDNGVDGSNGITQGEGVTVSAPGMATVAKTASDSGYLSNTSLSGTSMATPLVAGSIAAALDAHPDWTVNKTTTWVEKSARPIPNAAQSEVGAGMVAVDNLVDQVDPPSNQSEAMDDAAGTRDAFWEWLSDSTGGTINEILRSFGF